MSDLMQNVTTGPDGDHASDAKHNGLDTESLGGSDPPAPAAAANPEIASTGFEATCGNISRSDIDSDPNLPEVSLDSYAQDRVQNSFEQNNYSYSVSEDSFTSNPSVEEENASPYSSSEHSIRDVSRPDNVVYREPSVERVESILTPEEAQNEGTISNIQGSRSGQNNMLPQSQNQSSGDNVSSDNNFTEYNEQVITSEAKTVAAESVNEIPAASQELPADNLAVVKESEATQGDDSEAGSQPSVTESFLQNVANPESEITSLDKTNLKSMMHQNMEGAVDNYVNSSLESNLEAGVCAPHQDLRAYPGGEPNVSTENESSLSPEQGEVSAQPTYPDQVKEGDVEDECLKEHQEEKEEKDMDILGNGLLVKKVLKRGNKKIGRPVHGDVVTIKLKGQLPSGAVVDEYETFIFVLGDGDVVQALDICIALMDVEECSELTAAAKYAYGTLGREPDIPADTDIVYLIELIKRELQPDYDKISIDDRIAAGEKKRERGNYLFTRNDYVGAVTSYSRAVKILEAGQAGSNDDAKKLQLVLNSKLKCYNNMAACQLKVFAYDQAISSCESVLKVQSQNVKALFRLGKAHSCKGSTKEAILCLKKALKLEPETMIIHQELARLTNKLKKETESERAMYKKMLGTDKAATNSKSSKNTSWWQVTMYASAVSAVLFAIGIAAYRYSQH